MPESITEWEFVADVASWINETLAKEPSLPFYRAKCEQRGKGSNERRDLTILDKNKKVILTGEVKLPYKLNGGSPYNENLVNDARKKAVRAKVDYFFTWNVNECVLWETFPPKTKTPKRKYRSWNITTVSKETHMNLPMTEHAIKRWLPVFLEDFSDILRGKFPLGLQSPDEKFIEILESSLKMPIYLTIEQLDEKYQTTKFQSQLDKWMREDQGWTILDDPEGIRDNLERASKFACYALVNKLVFYEALLKRYKTRLDKIIVPDHIESGDDLRLYLEKFFADAKIETDDYETVFGENHTEIGNRIPFYSNHAVSHWRELINQIHLFDFSKLDYEIIGNIFERLISPEERHKYGQFYTRPEVVDLINSFCILSGEEKIMDPACGGGTFLVRAYARKREIAPSRNHSQIIKDLYGVDISHFAAHLTTINLATRDLIDEENYPQIVRNDFFNILSQKPFMYLPKHAKKGQRTRGLGKIQQREVEIPQLDAVIGNPPYVRQEDIPKSKKKRHQPKTGTKEYYKNLVGQEWRGLDFSGRSDLHCYFWPHAAHFLKDDGYLCLLTSSQWLDVEYGFHLQKWILENFRIIAILESLDEPWFVGARVATTVTILKRENKDDARMNNTTRFIQLRHPLKEILVNDGTTAGAITAANTFRDEILRLNKDALDEKYSARLVRQGDLWDEGVKLGQRMGKPEEYFGGKWGIYLRAPDFWFDLLKKTQERWAPLGEISKIKYGIKTGLDGFFYVQDVTKEYLGKFETNEEFYEEIGVQRENFFDGKLKIVRCGEKYEELKIIESQYLEPEAHSLMEVGFYNIRPQDCKRLVLLISKTKSELKNSFALEYIRWGEKNGWNLGSTCASRVTENREWYDLTGHNRAPALWPKERQYRHIAPSNDSRLIANCRFYEIYPPHDLDDPNLWGGILNTTWTLFSSLQFGRPVGNEGSWSTMVIDANMMLIPDPRKPKKNHMKKVINAFKKLKKRQPISFLSERRLREMAFTKDGRMDELEELPDNCELDMEDRRGLDDAVLEMLGVSSNEKRSRLINQLYDYLGDYFERTRQKEEKAIENKQKSKRRGPASPKEIANQIFKELSEKNEELLKKYDPDFIDVNKPFDVFEIPQDGIPEIHDDMFATHTVKFVKGKKILKTIETKNAHQAPLISLIATSGGGGLVRIPHKIDDCKRVFNNFQALLNERDARLWELLKERTADQEMQGEIYEALKILIS